MNYQVSRFFSISLLLICFFSFFQHASTQTVVENKLRIPVNRGRNNCVFKSNPTHAWIFYVNGQERYRLGFGGAASLTVDVPLKDNDYNTHVNLTATIYEPKCVGSGIRSLGTVNFGSIFIPPIPVSSPAPITIANGVYKLKTKSGGRPFRLINEWASVFSTGNNGGSQPRIVFEPTGTDGIFYIRVENDRTKFLKVEHSRLTLVDYPDAKHSRFSIDKWNDDTYSIRQGNKYLYENRSDSKIKLGAVGNVDKARFSLSETPRSVRFMATGDPQLENGNMAHDDDEYIITKAVLDKFGTYSYGGDGDDYRGVIISGDLTQNTRKDELDKYKKLTKDYTGYLFDGLGNHDMASERFCWDWDNVSAGYAACKSKLRDYVKRGRSYPIAEREGIHYSWNWDDVHFVQLNLFPGEESNYLPNESNANLDPQGSLSFLKRDLAKQVGESGRPVVLIHHYGFDNLSSAWWTQDERNAYWEAIADYNIVAIISGHLHGSGSIDWWSPDFIKPCNSSKGPDFIPTFVAGGVVNNGYYCSMSIQGDILTVDRYQATITTKNTNITGTSYTATYNSHGEKRHNFERPDNNKINFEERLVKATTEHAVYLVEDGKRRHIPNRETLFAMGYDWNYIKCFPKATLDNIPLGTPIPSRKDGNLLQGQDNRVYIMQSGYRRWIRNWDVFQGFFSNSNNIQSVSDDDLAAIPQGTNYN